jgi:hypothetical protein
MSDQARSLGLTMTPLIAPALRSGLLTAAGTALIVAPLALGVSAAAIVTGVVIGAVAVALGLAGTEPGGRATLPLSAQAVFDRVLALGLLAAAFIFGVGDEAVASLLFAAAGLGALIVTSMTRYSARPT